MKILRTPNQNVDLVTARVKHSLHKNSQVHSSCLDLTKSAHSQVPNPDGKTEAQQVSSFSVESTPF